MATTPRITDIRRELRAIDPDADFKVSRYDKDDAGSVKVTTYLHCGVEKAAAWLEANGFTVDRDKRGRACSEVIGGRHDFRHMLGAWPVAS